MTVAPTAIPANSPTCMMHNILSLLSRYVHLNFFAKCQFLYKNTLLSIKCKLLVCRLLSINYQKLTFCLIPSSDIEDKHLGKSA
jgi:hypothetical protein